MKMLNNCVFVGRLVKEPEAREAENGMVYSYNSLAIDEGEEKTTFIPLVLYGKIAESVAKCLNKGSKIGVCGKLRSRKYETKDGITREVLELHVDNVEFLEPKKEVEEEQPKKNTYNNHKR